MDEKSKRSGVRGFLASPWFRSNKCSVLVPVYIDSSHKQRRHTSGPHESHWYLCTAWLRYHYVQWSWDTERMVARLLHRRWI